jgi:hypothetical protein
MFWGNNKREDSKHAPAPPETTNRPPDPVRLHLMLLPPGIAVAIDAAMMVSPDATIIEIHLRAPKGSRKGFLKASMAFDITPEKPMTDHYGRTLPPSESGYEPPF